MIALFGMIAMTIGFIRRDLAWDGTWKIRQLHGRKTATISAPWPTERWDREPQTENVLVRDESVYFTVAVPRKFERLDVRLNALAPQTVEVGAEVIPHTLRYSTEPLRRSGREWVGSLNILIVRQDLGKINVVLRFPGAGRNTPALFEAIEFTFRRPPWTLKSFFIRLWQVIRQ